jgi:hypothetical protein
MASIHIPYSFPEKDIYFREGHILPGNYVSHDSFICLCIHDGQNSWLCLVMQAEVQGQKITWITPHALQQVLTDDVDFNVMLSFLEFYEVNKYGPLLSSCVFHVLCNCQ